MKSFKDGDISQEEYYSMLQSDIAPLKEKKKDLEYDRKLTSRISEIKKDLIPKADPKIHIFLLLRLRKGAALGK